MPVLVQNIVILRCDGPRCTGLDGKGPLTLTFNQQEAQQNANTVPDAAFRFFFNRSFLGEEHAFCSVRCEHDWQTSFYVPPLSPREQEAQNAANAAAEARKSTGATPEQFGVDAVEEPVPVMQADIENPGQGPMIQSETTTPEPAFEAV